MNHVIWLAFFLPCPNIMADVDSGDAYVVVLMLETQR